MENSANDQYEKAKREAKEIYRKIGRIWCPALNDAVTFNRQGFHHLLQRHKKSRNKKEQITRFSLLPHAPSIIKESTSIAEYRENKLNSSKFWCLTENHDGKIIKVVIRQVGRGEKHFFSIFQRRNNQKQATKAGF